jgi:hypothetical protein
MTCDVPAQIFPTCDACTKEEGQTQIPSNWFFNSIVVVVVVVVG